MVEDMPDDLVHEIFTQTYWRGHALGRPILGTRQTVGHFERRELVNYFRRYYAPNNLIVAAAGNVEHARVVELTLKEFGGVAAGRPIKSSPAPVPNPHIKHRKKKDLEQVHICMGAPGFHQTHERRFPAYILNSVLGGGMSSRLFQEVRERRGRAYAVQSFLSTYRDTGYLGVYAGTNAEWVPEVMEVIVAEVRRLAQDGLGAEELVRTKNQLKGNMLLGLETSTSRMHRLATCELYFGRDIPLDEVAREIDAVSNDDVVELAQRLLANGLLAGAVLGDLKGTRVDESLLATLTP
jgi:predicted Zn-dependent peptidase